MLSCHLNLWWPPRLLVRPPAFSAPVHADGRALFGKVADLRARAPVTHERRGALGACRRRRRAVWPHLQCELQQ